MNDLVALVESRAASDPQLRALIKRVKKQSADFNDTADYSVRLAQILGKEMSENVLDIPEELREEVATELLKYGYNDLNDVLAEVQGALDEKNGIHIRPQKAAFPAERVQQYVHSLVDPTVADSVIKRRARAGTETITKSYHDDYMQKNASFRNDAGLKCYIVRTAVPKCCEWCSNIAGRYPYNVDEMPEDVFRRHDNCDCKTIFENGKQRQDVWSKRTWEVPETGTGAAEPVRFTPEQAAELQAKNQPKILTNGVNGGRLRVSGATSGALNPDSDRANKHAEQYYESVRKMQTDVKHIAENTGYSEDTIQSIKDFIFNEKHDLGDRYDYFDPDYKMAQSWQRLIDGKNILPHDLTLIKHEEMEKELMSRGYSQAEAHLIATKKYNYEKEAREYYDKINRNSKE
ncbi:hypothetical protein [Ruminococcus sp.]|uniref:hypothetical protein n=1 Tax=Ruminococcus sp. TaxID=41978 RepID=UPI001B749ADB|nr:hypothetical protein [Ruminococcus sp.]MBP5433862.1 hypothetical protein [Ruminococcus sp.]